MKYSEISVEANQIISTIFKEVIKSDNKEVWKKAIDFIQNKISDLSKKWDSDRFIWESVLRKVSSQFGKKFILIKN